MIKADTAPLFTADSSRNLLARYEELRRRVVQGQGGAVRSRLLLEQRGLAEWMRAWMADADVEMTPLPPAQDASQRAPSFDQSEVTMVLATMTLHCLKDSAA